MNVIGIDFGNDSCVVSVLRNNRVEIITNDYFERNTKSCVAFTSRNREIGVAAFNQRTTNVDNTFYGFKHQLKEDVHVNAGTLKESFKLMQILAMLLCRLKTFSASEGQPVEVVDCVIACPSYFDASEQNSIFLAAGVAGLNCISLIKETTAVAINYAFYKKFAAPCYVVFVDFGHKSLQICICELTTHKIKVLAEDSAMIGGQDIDEKLAEYFIDLLKIPEATKANKSFYFGLLLEVEKLKKKLGSSTARFSLRLELLLRDQSKLLTLDRSEMENICASIFNQVKQTMITSLNKSGLDLEDIHSIEIVGGSTRIPRVKNLVKEVFGKEASITMNQDEAVAKGCVFKILSSMTKRKLEVEEPQNFKGREISMRHGVQMRIKDLHSKFVGPEEDFLPVTRHQLEDFRKTEAELEKIDKDELKRRDERNALDKYCIEIKKSEIFAKFDQKSRDKLSSMLNETKHWNDGTAEEYLEKRKKIERWIENKTNQDKIRVREQNLKYPSHAVENELGNESFEQKWHQGASLVPERKQQKITIRTLNFEPILKPEKLIGDFGKRKSETIMEGSCKKKYSNDEEGRIIKLYDDVKNLVKHFLSNSKDLLDFTDRLEDNTLDKVKLTTVKHLRSEEKCLLEEQLHRCWKKLANRKDETCAIWIEIQYLKCLVFAFNEHEML